ncbi:MAG TPA: hypothetical protein PLZ84_02840, partial [Clostridia bacterium]|nr:hypothetical protein [Clostridia bacterium]
TASAAAGAILSVRKGIAKLFKAILSIRIRPKRRKFVYLEEAYEEDIDVLDVEAESDFPAIHTQRRIIVPQNVLKKAPDMPVKDEKAFETQLHNLQPGGFAQQEDTVIQDSLLDTQSRLAAVKEYKEKVIVEAPKDKYEVMIEKAVQLIGQKKYHLAKQVLSASLATESIVLRKRANMLLLECLIELREHTKARKRLFKVLGSNFDLSADEKMRIKEIMLSLPDMQSAKKPKSVAADDNLNETGGIDVQENASAASEGELPSAPAQIEIVLPETVSEDNESEDLVKDEEVSEAPAVHELQTEDFIKETEAAAEEDDADTQPQLAALEESKEEYNTETQTPKGKYEVMIDKACELISQKKYYLSKQLLAASLASDSVVLRKRSNILMLECMVGLGEYAQARKGLFEVLGGNFDLSPEDKARLKKIMLTIK